MTDSSTPQDLRYIPVTLPDESLRDDVTVVLLHGFGASAQDLVPLAREIGRFRNWIFPGAPCPIEAMGMTYGQAWFPRDSKSMEMALYGRYFNELRTMEPPGLTESAREIMHLLDSRGIDPASVVLGGFSQGTMVSAEYVRLCLETGRALPRALLFMSGALIAEEWWKRVSSDAPELPPVFQSHGRNDAVLPFGDGAALAETLQTVGFDVRFMEFSGGHEIPLPVVRGIDQFLAEHFTD